MWDEERRKRKQNIQREVGNRKSQASRNHDWAKENFRNMNGNKQLENIRDIDWMDGCGKTEKRFFGNVKMTIKRRARKRERERQINLRNCQKAVFASTKKCLQSKPCLKLEIIITIGIKDVRNVFHSCFIAIFFAKIKNFFSSKELCPLFK